MPPLLKTPNENDTNILQKVARGFFVEFAEDAWKNNTKHIPPNVDLVIWQWYPMGAWCYARK